MQYNAIALALAIVASVATAQSTVTVTVCPSSTTAAPSVVFSSTVPVVASTGVNTPPTPTGSPISYATGAASANAVSGSVFGMIMAGGIALLF